MPSPRQLTVIDLFSGAGGFTWGFVKAGFRPVLAVEKEESFAATYAANFGEHVVAVDIGKLLEDGTRIPQADVVIGGPPCQGFSNLTGNRPCDPRRKLWQCYMDVVEKSGCSVFVVENVPNLLTSPEGRMLIERGRELGFAIDETSKGILNASLFGVPQRRRRAFIIGSKIGTIPLPPPPQSIVSVRTAFKNGLHTGDAPIPSKPTCKEIEHLPAFGPHLHLARKPTALSLARYKLVPEGGNRFDLQRAAPHLTPRCWLRKQSGGTDLFGRLNWDLPANCTIRCEFYKPEKGRYLHPSADRPLTHWEAARLQSFPDNFKWHGTKVEIATQIGNAVPPILARAVALEVKKHLNNHMISSHLKEAPLSRLTSARRSQ